MAYGFSSSFKETDWKRRDRLRFPRLTIREALLNAFIHRDYSSYSNSTAINIYPYKLQIVSYGRLPKGISIKSLSEDYLSIPINPDIAHIFFLRRWIEKIGRGTVKMISQCEEQGFRVPIWKVKDYSIIITFPDVRVPFDYTKGINKLLNKHRTEGISEEITDTVKNILVDIIELLIQEDKKLRVSEIAKTLDIPDKSIERHIKRLREINAIVCEGFKRTGGYIVTEELPKSSNIKNNLSR